jgi:hypothetical protein
MRQGPFAPRLYLLALSGFLLVPSLSAAPATTART